MAKKSLKSGQDKGGKGAQGRAKETYYHYVYNYSVDKGNGGC